MNNVRNKFKYLYALIFFMSIAIILFMLKGTERINFYNIDNVVNYEFQWNINNEDCGEKEISQNPFENKVKKVSIWHKIDDEMIKNKYLFFRSTNKNIKVYVDDEEIYNYGDSSILYPLNEYTWNIVKIEKEYVGKNIKIMSCIDKNALCKIDKITLSNDWLAVLVSIMTNEISSIIISLIFIFISIVLLFVWLITIRILKNNKVLYLCILSILVSIGFVINTRVLRIALQNYRTFDAITCEIIMLIPMAIILHYLGDKHNKLPFIIEITPVVNFILCNTLYLFKILSLEQMLDVINIFLVFDSVLFSIIYIHKVILKKEKDNKKADLGFIVMVVLILIDFTKYNLELFSSYFNISRIGILLYVSTLAYDVLMEILNIFVIGKKAEVYKHLAYNDILTGHKNRFAFEEKMNGINNFNYKCRQTLLIMIDINNLKLINDSEGHESGDDYIIDNINFINERIKSLGCIYRTGGDEFVIIALKRNAKELDKIFYNMEEEIKESNKNIDFAYGFAQFDEKLDKDVYDTLKRADKNMYRNKDEIKKLRSKTS